MDICQLSAAELGSALRRGDLSAAEALDAALARGTGGPLCGIPVTTKDSHWMAGVESTSGSRSRWPASTGGTGTACRRYRWTT